MSEKYYSQILIIALNCLAEKIPFEIKKIWEGWQIVFPWADHADVAIHDGTFGHDSLQVESYKFPWDEGDVSVLEPFEAFELIRELWKSLQ